ncbi:hypothetical protein [Halosegnis marinus]|uniref:DUF8159 domain-containing protein n=1 Tax=Halosegnis marinus TaxID=3034023 RepID=A0ABD5ZNQ0_9EURY|nr:hypothetical protein [Halosegnis sp. DT85]
MTLSPEELGDVLETHLMGEGLYVTNCERHEGAIHVGYESPAVGESVPRGQVGTLLRTLLDLAGIETEGRDLAGIPEVGEWEPEDVEVWVFEDADADDRVTKGHYEVREGWFRALERDDLSETDFSTLVLSTLE